MNRHLNGRELIRRQRWTQPAVWAAIRFRAKQGCDSPVNAADAKPKTRHRPAFSRRAEQGLRPLLIIQLQPEAYLPNDQIRLRPPLQAISRQGPR